MEELTPTERLIVAADFKPHSVTISGRADVRSQVLTLADGLKGTGVYVKVNSALRACGYGLISEIHSRGLRVFADLKLYDIGETLATDGVLLREVKPELLTVVCSAGIKAMRMLKAELPDTEVLGVTVLTSLKDDDTKMMWDQSVAYTAARLAHLVVDSDMDGLICAATEAEMMRDIIGVNRTINTPAIRPVWAIVPGDDQNPDRIMTPAKAIKAGADRIVIGRPIVRDKNPHDAVMRTIDEISKALASAEKGVQS
jgi:orotidine-5'-phosphate decarboxylase